MLESLRVDIDKNRWITKTLSGLGKGTEIWTHAIPIGENKIKVIVDFYVPKLPALLKAKFAGQYNALYAHLYDEDLWMMAGRQTALNKLDKVLNVLIIFLILFCKVQKKRNFYGFYH